MKYFNALAEEGAFGRAAESCHVSQPALSLQIKELEEMIGAPLVERGSRKISLTPLGQDVALHVASILRQVRDLEDFMRLRGGGFSGKLRLGLIPTVAPYLLPRIITGLARRFPDQEIVPREATTDMLIRDLHSAKLDAALLALPVSESALAERALMQEDFLLVEPEGAPQIPIQSAKTLEKMRLLLLEEGHCFRDQALAVCASLELSPGDIIEGSSLTTLVQMVIAGIGVTLLPRMALPIESGGAGLRITAFPDPKPTRTIGLVWRKSSPLDAAYEEIAQELQHLLTV